MFEFDLVSRPHEEGSWRRRESPRLHKRASILSELRVNSKQSDIQTCPESPREGTRDKRELPVRRFVGMAPRPAPEFGANAQIRGGRLPPRSIHQRDADVAFIILSA
jgi:hypothetical protein